MKSLVAAVVFVALVQATPAGAADFKASSCFAVVDANGKVLGTLNSFQTNETIVSTNGRLITIQSNPDLQNFAGMASGQMVTSVLFLTPDCSGTPYVPASGSGFNTPSAIAGSRFTIFVPQAGAQAGIFTAQSVLVTGDDTCYGPAGVSTACRESLS